MHTPVSITRHFVLPIRVYYEDTDAGGVVYHSNYLSYCERARTEWLRVIGVEQGKLRAESSIVFVVRRVEAEYLLGAELDDLLEVHTGVSRVGGASIDFTQWIMRGAERVFVAKVTIACVDWSVRRAVRIPDDLKNQLENCE